ncbi:hypothetical protein [Stratiformator vulcanicus]|uniref:Uncharacterized protein n=1 Tax=Stratiformator vulcanicus TaxID=2527980 RepID=A0A517R377_9PLAN|nr:hypothetical protein [Stratiformator vulcanicus]QDT38287.1 hypothetical protein Pan189_26770 [Stratiformator vulcanicus]
MRIAILAACLLMPVGIVSSAGAAEPSLKWVGTWAAEGKEEHCKELRCEAEQVDGDQWKAKFTGVCSEKFCFYVEMNGKAVGEKIIFSGETDLGEDNGGLYTWSGEIVGDEFKGQYAASAGKKGTFEMKPVPVTE